MPECAVAVESSIYVYNIQTGKCLRVYQGDNALSRPGIPWGHTKTIVCLYYFGEYIYSGSLDGTCRVWWSDPARKVEKKSKVFVKRKHRKGKVIEKEEPKAIFTLIGHDDNVRALSVGLFDVLSAHNHIMQTSVWSVVADQGRVLTGGSDAKILAWHPRNGKLLRKIRGHEATVTDIKMGGNHFISCSIDQTVRGALVLATRCGLTQCADSNMGPRRRRRQPVQESCDTLQNGWARNGDHQSAHGWARGD